MFLIGDNANISSDHVDLNGPVSNNSLMDSSLSQGLNSFSKHENKTLLFL